MAVQLDLSVKESVSSESSFYYTNKYLDQDMEFTPTGDEVVTTLMVDSRNTEIESLAASSAVQVRVADAERGFAVLSVGGSSSADAIQDDISSAPGSNNAIPAMMDSEGNRRYFMPDEFTVQFSEDQPDSRSIQLLKSHGCRIVEKHRSPGYFTASVPEGRGLFDIIRDISDDDSVIFSEPSEIGVDDALSAPPRSNSKRSSPGSSSSSSSRSSSSTATVDLPEQESVLRIEDFDLSSDGVTEVGPGVDALDGAIDSSEAASTLEEHFGSLWALRNTGQSVEGVSGRPDADIDAHLAWSITQGTARAVVAVIDTGVDMDHPDLSSRIVSRGSDDWDFADRNDDIPWDSGQHGTHVAGSAVGSANRTGVVGVAPGASLLPLRINLSAGMNANRADAINYVAARARRDSECRYIINCSWRTSGQSAAILHAIRRARAAGALVIFAAGNSNRNLDSSPQYPGSYSEVMSVAASDQLDQRASFSNYGASIDITAPGVNILSSVPDDTHGYFNGTSMAAPHVAGAAALVWSRNPNLSAQQVRDILQSSCDSIDSQNPGMSGKLGSGRLNVYRALRATPVRSLRPRVKRTLQYPQQNAGSSTGLTFAPSFSNPGLWSSRQPALVFLTQQAGSERIYCLNPHSGRELHSFDPEGNDTVGSLAWHGRQVYLANVTTGAGWINVVDPRSGSQMRSISVPSGRGEGLAHDGHHIYYSTQTTIYRIDPTSGRVLSSFPSPGGQCRAMAHSRGRLLIGDSSTGRIVGYNIRTRLVDFEITAPGSGHQRVEGLAYDSRRRELYIANQSENRIYVLDLPQAG